MCSQSYIHLIDVPAHVQAGRYILTCGDQAISRATESEDCPQYRQRVVDAIRALRAVAAHHNDDCPRAPRHERRERSRGGR